jgi:hypothetical protein
MIGRLKINPFAASHHGVRNIQEKVEDRLSSRSWLAPTAYSPTRVAH